jgi:hypothetical protein
MKHRKLIIFLVLGMAFVAFFVGVNLYQSRVQSAQELQVAGQRARADIAAPALDAVVLQDVR